MPVIGQPGHKAVTISPFNGRLACGKNIHNSNHICIIKTGAKLFKQVIEPRIAMRLMHGHDPARMGLTCRFERGGNFHRMMSIVINHCNPANFSHPREAAIDALETLQTLADRLRAHTQMQRHGHGRQSIRDIVISWHGQGAIGDHTTIAQRHVKIGRALGIGQIDSPHIGLGVKPIGHNPAIRNSSDQSLHFGVICVADR